MEDLLFKMENINKSFGQVNVLKSVNLEVRKGEIHALMGENGAGKSTLMKILGGVIKRDSGHITFEGRNIPVMTSDIAKDLGIGFVHQELNIAENITVAENVFIGRFPYKNKMLGIIDFKKLYKDTQEILERLGASFEATDIVERLSAANKQLVEIAKAISLDAKVIIFDEPTTSLSNKDVENLFKIIRGLKKDGVSTVYISHRMVEIYELCERITILRDGVHIGTDNVHEIGNEQIIKMMVGRSLENLYPKEEVEIGDVSIEVNKLSDRRQNVKEVSFKAHSGEIVGFAGLVGAGRTELMRLLFGADKYQSGEIKIKGSVVNIKTPVDAKKNGICLLTEDRKHQGLALGLSIKDNINITGLKSPILNHKEINRVSERFIDALKIKVSDSNKPVSSLSGGNQQKIVLAKWLNTDSDIFIFDEPTKGIDVGAKSEIYHIIGDLANKGKTILMISSEIPELLGICDRIYVICEGKVTGELTRDKATQERIMELATVGGK